MNWNLSSGFYAFAVIALVIGVLLMLVVVTTSEEDLNELDAHNTTRSTLFLLLALVLAVFILVHQRYEMVSDVKSLLM